MKRILALLLATALVMGLSVPVFADNGYNGNGENGYDYEAGAYYNGENGYNGNGENGYNGYEYQGPAVWEAFDRPFRGYDSVYGALSITGYIGEITLADCGNYTVEILDAEGNAKRIVWLLPALGYAVIDANTGQPAELEDHGGGEVLVFYGPNATFHNVPQSNALVIAINVEEAEYPVLLPRLYLIEKIEEGEDGERKLTVDNGGLIVTLNEETELQAWLTRQIVVLDEFQVGDEVVVWLAHGIMGMSFPAHATATRALRLVPAQAQNGYAEYAPEYPENGYNDVPEYPVEPYDYVGYDKELYTERPALTGAIVRAGVNLYPVRVNANALGFEVAWDAEQRIAILTNNGAVVTLAPNTAIFYVNGAPVPMTAPSLLEGGVLFAPSAFFYNL